MKTLFRTLIGLSAACLCAAASAASFPSKPVTLIVPFPAGGTTDILARDIGNELARLWNQPVIIDNKGGASGTIGSANLTRSKADGYTLMVTATHHIINPTLLKASIPYDTKTAFTNLAMLATVPSVLVVNKNFPPQTVQELIDLAKQKPGTINFGSAGIGGANHLAGELFAHMAGIELTHIPYRGAAPSLSDLLAGQIPMMFDSVPGVIAHINSGALRALGVSSAQAIPQLPDVPPIAQAGVPGFEAVAMFGLYGPAGLAPEVVGKIEQDMAKVLTSDTIRQRFEQLGATPGTLSQAEFSTYVDQEIDKWQQVIESAGISLE